MELEQIKARHRASFSGTIPLSELKSAGDGFTLIGVAHATFHCPCGGKDHFATAVMHYDADGSGRSHTMSPVLHCWEHGRQWMILKDVEAIIAREERVAVALFDRFGHMAGRRVTAAEAFRLRTEQGCPEDFLDVDDAAEFDRLMARHHETSRSGA